MARTKQTARRKTEDEGEAGPKPTKVWVEAESGVEKGRKRKRAKAEKAEKVEKVDKVGATADDYKEMD